MRGPRSSSATASITCGARRIASFDVIIVNSDRSDRGGRGAVHRRLLELRARADRARPGVNQCGVPFMQASELRDTSARRAKFFPHVTAYVAAVPTYVGGFMTLGWAAKDAALTRVRWRRSGSRARRPAFSAQPVWTPGNSCRGIQPAALYRTGTAWAVRR